MDTSTSSASNYPGSYGGSDRNNGSTSSTDHSYDYPGAYGTDPTSGDSIASTRTTADALTQSLTTGETLRQSTATDAALDAVSTGLVAVPGASLPLNGLTVGGQSVVDSMKFGRFAPNSTIPNHGYSLSTFTQPGRAQFFSTNTMVSSQASWMNARQLDPTLSSTRFEVPSPDTSVNRTYDRAFGDTYFEDKAGKSISARQLATDIDLARTGTSVQYTFSGNPVTGNHGPDARVSATLDTASDTTRGRLTSVVSDIEVSPATVDAVQSASRVSTTLRGASRVAAPVAAAIDVYRIGSTAAEHGVLSTETAAVVTETAGGWAGAGAGGIAGAKGGAAVGALVGGPAGAAVGAVVGAVGGAVAGAIAGSEIGKSISRFFGW